MLISVNITGYYVHWVTVTVVLLLPGITCPGRRKQFPKGKVKL